MVVRVLLICCALVGCLDNQRGISGVDKSSDALGDTNYEVVYGLEVSSNRVESCWTEDEDVQDSITMTVTVKVGQQTATNGVGAGAMITLFDSGRRVAVKKAKQGRATFILSGESFELDEYHYLEVTAKIRGRQEVVTAFSDGFAFVSECG